MNSDISTKRALFVKNSVETRELFKFAPSEEIINALHIHNSSFYGSSLWDLESDRAKQFYHSWNTAVKLAWGCPQQTRINFVQQMLSCGYFSARAQIYGRYIKFFNSLRMSSSKEVQFLSRFLGRDIRSVTGRNLIAIREITTLNPWTTKSHDVKMAVQCEEMVPVPHQDRWRLRYLSNLISQRRQFYVLAMEENLERTNELIRSLVVN